MHALDVLADPVRRALLDDLARRAEEGEDSASAGALADVVRARFGISQPAVSQHLAVLRENGFVTVTPQGRHRLYALAGPAWVEVGAWVDRYSALWANRLDALETELRRGRQAASSPTTDPRSTT